MPERRQVPRYLCELRAQLLQPASGSRRDITVVTLSVKGCGIEGAGNLNQGQKCELRIEWHGKDLRAEAEVIWIKPEGRVGLRFVSVKEETLAVLREVCATLPLQPLAKLPPEPEEQRQA